jgi:hypothetical protein
MQKHDVLEIKNFRGDHVEIKFNGAVTVNGSSFNDAVLTICRFFDCDPATMAGTCTAIKPRYDEAVAALGLVGDRRS